MQRYSGNPIITPADITPSAPGMEVVGAFNAAATRFRDEILLLLRVAERPITTDPDSVAFPLIEEKDGRSVLRRVEVRRTDPDVDASDPRAVVYKGCTYLSSISHLRLARSHDGYHFTIDPKPTILPSGLYERYGIEDPRISQIGDTYWITYTSVSELGITVSAITTQDWVNFQRRGVCLPPENKDVAIIPGILEAAASTGVGSSAHRYAMLHRPYTQSLGSTPDIWLAYSPDLVHWGEHYHVAGVRPRQWDSVRIGAGAPPLLTPDGWLELYHGANETNTYCLGLLLLDRTEPHRVLARSKEPFLAPSAPYEKSGFFGNVVFSCGWVAQDDGRIFLYYGAADESTAVAETSLAEAFAHLGLS
ncbi:MAG: glycoside hydrolase family 130 protein [Limnochordaceae bacterium]|nr:glycoside hydrolase family 130 protein [Limnochordaceae bacterium]